MNIKPVLNALFKIRLSFLILSILGFAWFSYQGLFIAPAEQYQGEVSRIIYIHVPCAWMSMLIYTSLLCSAISYLVWRNINAFDIIKSSATFGIILSFLTLLTGSIWGLPTWGTWWEWDGRMTSMLLMLFIYIGIITMINMFDSPSRAAFFCSIFIIFGATNIPVIKFSVEWWNSQHQSSSTIRSGGTAIDNEILIPMLGMFISFIMFYIWQLLVSFQSEQIIRRLKRKAL